MTKSFFALFYTAQHVFLYGCTKKSIRLLLQEPLEKNSTILSSLSLQKNDPVLCFDGNVHQEIKKESSPSFLSWIEFLYWYKEKKQHFKKNGSYFFLRASFFHRNIFSVSLEPSPPLLNMLHRLSVMNRKITFLSYGAELGRMLKNLLPTLSHIEKNFSHLLVSMDKNFSMNLWFFQKHEMIFWRSWENIALEKIPDLHTIISETLRYGEKLYGTAANKIVIFWEPQDFPESLSENFPQGLFFHGNTLSAFLEKEGIPFTQDLNIFHTLLLCNRTPHYKLSTTYSWKEFFNTLTLKKWMPYIEYVMIFCLFLSLLGALLQWHYLRASQHDYKKKQHNSHVLQEKIALFSFPQTEACLAEEMHKKQNIQEKNIITFFIKLEDFIGEHCVVEQIIFQEDMAKISFLYHTPFTVSEYKNEWSRFFPHITPSFFPMKNGVIIECHSPLSLKKNILKKKEEL